MSGWLRIKSNLGQPSAARDRRRPIPGHIRGRRWDTMAVLTKTRTNPLRVALDRAGRYFGKAWPLYVMVIPGLAVLAVFHYYPMYGIVIAFQDYNPGLGFGRSPWVGLE